MKKGKKGDVTLETIVKFIPQFLIFIAFLAIAFGIYSVFFAKEKPEFERDLDRIVKEIELLRDGQSIAVPIASKDSQFAIYEKGDVRAPRECQGLPCVCGFSGKESSCQRIKFDVAETFSTIVKPIYICRQGKAVSFGGDPEHCLRFFIDPEIRDFENVFKNFDKVDFDDYESTSVFSRNDYSLALYPVAVSEKCGKNLPCLCIFYGKEKKSISCKDLSAEFSVAKETSVEVRAGFTSSVYVCKNKKEGKAYVSIGAPTSSDCEKNLPR